MTGTLWQSPRQPIKDYLTNTLSVEYYNEQELKECVEGECVICLGHLTNHAGLVNERKSGKDIINLTKRIRTITPTTSHIARAHFCCLSMARIPLPLFNISSEHYYNMVMEVSDMM